MSDDPHGPQLDWGFLFFVLVLVLAMNAMILWVFTQA